MHEKTASSILLAVTVCTATYQLTPEAIVEQLNTANRKYHLEIIGYASSLNEDDTKQSFIVLETASTVCIGCRGSYNFADWKTNFTVYKEGSFDGQAHSGFLSRSKQLRIRKIMDFARSKSKRLIFTGHSMGGAVAVLGAMDAMCNEPDLDIECITFGAPSVGDVRMYYSLKSLDLLGRFTNFVNKQDPVPGILNMAATIASINKATSAVKDVLVGISGMFGIVTGAAVAVGFDVVSSCIGKLRDISISASGADVYIPFTAHAFVLYENASKLRIEESWSTCMELLRFNNKLSVDNLQNHSIRNYETNISMQFVGSLNPLDGGNAVPVAVRVISEFYDVSNIVQESRLAAEYTSPLLIVDLTCWSSIYGFVDESSMRVSINGVDVGINGRDKRSLTNYRLHCNLNELPGNTGTNHFNLTLRANSLFNECPLVELKCKVNKGNGTNAVLSSHSFYDNTNEMFFTAALLTCTIDMMLSLNGNVVNGPHRKAVKDNNKMYLALIALLSNLDIGTCDKVLKAVDDALDIGMEGPFDTCFADSKGWFLNIYRTMPSPFPSDIITPYGLAIAIINFFRELFGGPGIYASYGLNLQAYARFAVHWWLLCQFDFELDQLKRCVVDVALSQYEQEDIIINRFAGFLSPNSNIGELLRGVEGLSEIPLGATLLNLNDSVVRNTQPPMNGIISITYTHIIRYLLMKRRSLVVFGLKNNGKSSLVYQLWRVSSANLGVNGSTRLDVYRPVPGSEFNLYDCGGDNERNVEQFAEVLTRMSVAAGVVVVVIAIDQISTTSTAALLKRLYGVYGDTMIKRCLFLLNKVDTSRDAWSREGLASLRSTFIRVLDEVGCKQAPGGNSHHICFAIVAHPEFVFDGKTHSARLSDADFKLLDGITDEYGNRMIYWIKDIKDKIVQMYQLVDAAITHADIYP